jgi:hypothetical protein
MFCAHPNPNCEHCYLQSQGEEARSRIYYVVLGKDYSSW